MYYYNQAVALEEVNQFYLFILVCQLLFKTTDRLPVWQGTIKTDTNKMHFFSHRGGAFRHTLQSTLVFKFHSQKKEKNLKIGIQFSHPYSDVSV